MLNIFTIALNERENIQAQYAILQKLTTPWQWCVSLGYSRPVNDTAWCKDIQAPPDDGSRELLSIVAGSDARVLVVDQKEPWSGKTEQVNAALDALALRTPQSESVLFQLDADEFWAPWQMELIVRVFGKIKKASTIRFRCRYWVGPNRVAVGYNSFGNYSYEWFRAWRWDGSKRFKTHEPPVLDGPECMVDADNALMGGLHFEHRAYCDEARVAFKEKYYGYKNLLKNWRELNQKRGPSMVQPGVFGNAKPFLTVEA
jgi:hypothetical protein